MDWRALLVIGPLCLWVQTAQAQEDILRLNADLVATDQVIVLPEALARTAGYPQWRVMRMSGPSGVPYNYCQWLLDARPWALQVFGTDQWSAVTNCAQGISVVTQAQVDEDLPLDGDTNTFWRTRPVGYEYMVPDYGLSQAEFVALMQIEVSEVPGFVTDPQALADYLSQMEERLTALEEWQESMPAAADVLTTDALQTWMSEQGYVLRSELPDGELLTLERAQELFADADTVLTREQADELYQAKGTNLLPASSYFWLWFWWLLALSIVLVVGIILWYFLYRRVAEHDKALKDKNTGLQKTHALAVQASQTTGAGIALGLPIGWELLKGLPTQEQLDIMESPELVTVWFIHEDDTKKPVSFTLVDEAFPQNQGAKKRGLMVSGDDTSPKPVACRVGAMLRKSRKALEAEQKTVMVPRDPKTGRFTSVPT